MRLRVYGTYYGDQYHRLARVWEASVRANCPGATVEVNRSAPRGKDWEGLYRRCGNHVTANTYKLGLWLQATREAVGAGEPLVIMDVDTIVLRDLREAFDANPRFDVAYTVRDYKIAYNAGVIFLRPTAGALEFMARWHAENNRIISAARNRRQATAEGRGTGHNYGGANQYALSRLLKSPPPNCNIETLPCNVWNSVDQTWDDFGPHTAVVHLKGNLRTLALDPQRAPGDPDGSAIDRILWTYRQYEAAIEQPAHTQEVATW